MTDMSFEMKKLIDELTTEELDAILFELTNKAQELEKAKRKLTSTEKEFLEVFKRFSFELAYRIKHKWYSTDAAFWLVYNLLEGGAGELKTKLQTRLAE